MTTIRGSVMKLQRFWLRLRQLTNCLALVILMVICPSATVLCQKTRPNATTTRANLKNLIGKLTQQSKPVTFQVLKESLPRNTSIAKPSWIEGDVATGNATEFSGELTGLAVFLNAQQREAIESGTVLTGEQTAFRDNDPLAYIQIYLADSTDQIPNSFAEATAGMLDKTLGRDRDVASYRRGERAGAATGGLIAGGPIASGVNDAWKGRINETRETRGWINSWISQRYSVDFWSYWYGRAFVVNIYLD